MVLALAVAGQLLLLGYQVRNQEDIRLVRVWAVTAITPAARALEAVRSGTASLFDRYFLLVGVSEQNRSLKAERDRLKLENQFLRAELATADRAERLRAFQARTPSKTIAARIIGASPAPDARVALIDRGTADGVTRGMAVITPDGVVGKVRSAYPTASQVVLITDAGFAAGVVSQKHYVEGTLRGLGADTCVIDYVRKDALIEVGEWFHTTGDDRVFPRGLPVGQVQSVVSRQTSQEIRLTPSGLRYGLEEVLVVLEPVHLPEQEAHEEPAPIVLAPPEPAERPSLPEDASSPPAHVTDADRLRQEYRQIGEGQGHSFGEGAVGSPAPDFNRGPASPQPPASGESGASAPPGSGAPPR